MSSLNLSQLLGEVCPVFLLLTVQETVYRLGPGWSWTYLESLPCPLNPLPCGEVREEMLRAWGARVPEPLSPGSRGPLAGMGHLVVWRAPNHCELGQPIAMDMSLGRDYRFHRMASP